LSEKIGRHLCALIGFTSLMQNLVTSRFFCEVSFSLLTDKTSLSITSFFVNFFFLIMLHVFCLLLHVDVQMTLMFRSKLVNHISLRCFYLEQRL